MRTLIIKSEYLPVSPLRISFDPSEMKDFEALHYALCEYDPGEEYTVEFKNVGE